MKNIFTCTSYLIRQFFLFFLSEVYVYSATVPPSLHCFAPFRQWDNVGMEKAVAAIEKGVSIWRAARVPCSTR